MFSIGTYLCARVKAYTFLVLYILVYLIEHKTAPCLI